MIAVILVILVVVIVVVVVTVVVVNQIGKQKLDNNLDKDYKIQLAGNPSSCVLLDTKTKI